MILQEVIEFLETLAPGHTAADWDNVGLLCGDPDKEIRTVVVALDADAATVQFAAENHADLLLTHHPVIFSPIRTVRVTDPVYTLIKHDVAAFAAHTNLDVAEEGVNTALAQTLGLRDVQTVCDGFGRVGDLSETMTPEAFADYVGDRLHTWVQVRKGDRLIKTVAVVGGSGGEFIGDVKADAFVTGEIKHHEWIAAPRNMTVVCAGHYATEVVAVEPLVEKLETAFPSLQVIPYAAGVPYETV